jgi:hypothetical protein
MTMVKKIILLTILILLVVSCGKKAPPVPWETVVPKRIVDLEAVSREGRLLLQWTFPKENTDKSILTDLAGFHILRSEGVLVGEECKGCGEKPKVVYEMKFDSKDERQGKKISISFEDQEPRKVYAYQVISINRRGHPSSPSNPVSVYWDFPPQAPGRVNAERGDKRVDLSWDPIEGIRGYHIYRRGGEGVFSLTPLNREPLTMNEYVDLNVENEKRYFYTIRAVKRVAKTDIEGKGSIEIPVTPTDLTPPDSPVDLVAIPLKNGIELNWKRNQDPDLLGYHVYRREPGENRFTRLTESPWSKEVYLDPHVQFGKDYEYAVTAVDNSINRNESPRSEEVRVKYLY